jgi:hypothetical protein
MFSLVLGSLPSPLTYCRVHQRTWVTSLHRWVAFHVPTREGSPVVDALCDHCLGQSRGGAEAGGGNSV